jgi:hypothetical protein
MHTRACPGNGVPAIGIPFIAFTVAAVAPGPVPVTSPIRDVTAVVDEAGGATYATAPLIVEPLSNPRTL